MFKKIRIGSNIIENNNEFTKQQIVQIRENIKDKNSRLEQELSMIEKQTVEMTSPTEINEKVLMPLANWQLNLLEQIGLDVKDLTTKQQESISKALMKKLREDSFEEALADNNDVEKLNDSKDLVEEKSKFDSWKRKVVKNLEKENISKEEKFNEWREKVTMKVEKQEEDSINHPKHYTKGKIEVADFIVNQKFDFLEGNVVKYVSRYKDKGTPLKDLKKAKWYLEKLISNLEKSEKEKTEQK